MSVVGVRLRAENARLLRLLEMRPAEARPPGPAQTGIFDARPGFVDNDSTPESKVEFYRTLLAARPDVYAVRWTTPALAGPGGCRRFPVADARERPGATNCR
jgi:hypothetical protein